MATNPTTNPIIKVFEDDVEDEPEPGTIGYTFVFGE
jgi:hypothetical protein